MDPALETTFQLLARTPNEAALDVLLAALDCPYQPSRDAALRALMDRHSPAGHDEVFRRLPGLDERSRAIVEQRPDRLLGVALDVVSRWGRPAEPPPKDPKGRSPAPAAAEGGHPAPGESEFRLACETVVRCRLYDALPALLAAAGNTASPHAALAAQTALGLTEAFYAELSAPGEPKRRDMEGLRHRMTTALQAAASGYARHRREEVVEAFLLLVKPQDPVLRRILRNPDEGVHAPIVKVLAESVRGGVLRLLMGFLEDPQSPQVVLDVIARRTDARFAQVFLETVGYPAQQRLAETLARIRSVAWAQPGHPLLAELEGKAQRGAVGLLCASAADRATVLKVVGHVLLEGKPEGRRAAAAALARFQGQEADALALRGLNDADPEVRAELVRQLRPRKVPGVLSILIRLVDNCHDVVREALRLAMPEFTAKRFLAGFDHMPEEMQQTAGHLVRKIDPDAVPQLLAEIGSLSPVRRRRAAGAAAVMGLIQEVEPAVIRLLSDDDHMVRIAAAKALAESKSMPSWEALRDALLDRSVIVREAAESSLQQIAVSLADEPSEDAAGEPAGAALATA